MTRLIPPRIDREDVEECMQGLARQEKHLQERGKVEKVQYVRAGRVVLERVLEAEDVS